METPRHPDVAHLYPGEQIEFATAGAEEEASGVAALLTSAGITPEGRHGLSAGLLLDLGGVVRLRAWEAAGLGVHREAGLPSAAAALRHVTDILVSAAADAAELSRAGKLGRAVFDLRMTRFAWAGPTELRADVALDDPDTDALIEALADFAWAFRSNR